MLKSIRTVLVLILFCPMMVYAGDYPMPPCPMEVNTMEVNTMQVDTMDVDTMDVVLLYMQTFVKGFDNFALAGDITQALDTGDWSDFQKRIERHLSDDKIQTLEDFYKRELRFEPVEITGFREFVMDDSAHVITTYKEEINEADLIIFNVPYTHQDIINITQFVQKNANKIGMIVIGWDDGAMNNFDNHDFSTYPRIADNYNMLFAFCKIQAPHIPIAYTVCMSPTWKAWTESFTTKPDAWAIWNITKFTANFTKLKSFFPIDQIGILGMNAGQNQEYDSLQYHNYINTIPQLNYKFSVWIPSLESN